MVREKIIFYAIISFAIILGLSTDYLFYQKPIGVSFFVFISLAAVFALAAAQKFGQKPSKTQVFILASAILLSAAVFLRTSPFLAFFNIIGGIYLLILFFALFAEKDILSFRFAKYLTAPLEAAIKSLATAAKPINEYVFLMAGGKQIGSEEFQSVVKGIILSLPILIILGFLLSSADSVFRIYLERFIQIKIDLPAIARALKIIVASYIFIGFFYEIGGENKEAPAEKNARTRPLGFIESATVLALVELLFLAFIAIQFFYLFGGKNYVWGLDEYVTYSEYAKSGFYELIMVAIVSFILIYAVASSSKIETLKEKKTFKFLSAALFVEITIILLSSLKRLLLYVDGYGLTLPRFLSFAFLLWIFCVFLFFLYKIISEKKNSVFIFMTFSLSVAFWIGINMANPDAFIAKVNIERINQGKKLDSYYFSNLSEDAVPETVKILRMNVNDEIKEKVAMNLDWRYASRNYPCNTASYGGMLYADYGISQCKPVLFSERIKNAEIKSPWQSFNLSKANALQVLKDNAAEIDKYEISYWKKAAAECKNSAAKCEENCANSALQPIEKCNENCNLKGCEEFGKNVKLYE